MLKISAFKGFVPKELSVDDNGKIPLPGDKLNHFSFLFLDMKYSFVGFEGETRQWIKREKLKAFQEMCNKNMEVASNFLCTLNRWKDSVNSFQNECQQLSDQNKRAIIKEWERTGKIPTSVEVPVPSLDIFKDS